MSLPCDFARCPGYDAPPCMTCARNVIYNHDDSRCYRVAMIRPDKPNRTGCPNHLTRPEQ